MIINSATNFFSNFLLTFLAVLDLLKFCEILDFNTFITVFSLVPFLHYDFF